MATRSVALVSTVLVIAWLLVAGSVSAGIYQWTDAQGRTHFGDKPTSKDAQELTIESSTSAAAASGAVDAESRRRAQTKLLELMDRERQQKKQAKAERKAEKIELQRRCSIMRQELADMLSGSYLYFDYNDAGEREIIDDATRQAKVDEMRETIKQQCG